MIKHISFIESNKENFNTPGGISFTDKSKFRPDVVNLRDKAIALNKTGGGMVGLYDNEDLDFNTMKSLAYARKENRDVTEIEQAKKYIERSIELSKESDKKKIEKTKTDKKLIETFEKIASNTEKTTEEE